MFFHKGGSRSKIFHEIHPLAHLIPVMQESDRGRLKEDIRLKIASLVENLNLFEISELILYYAKKK